MVIRRCGCIPSGNVLSLRDALVYRNAVHKEGRQLKLCYDSDNGKLIIYVLIHFGEYKTIFEYSSFIEYETAGYLK